ncbi:NADH-ubiquinone oxidoreductase-F iron-sulfur binding region domain-containing protein [Streptomyces violascens]|uniref:NADH-ubiquinone oxidoreductase-F iron-sulfur binding region domain-containing protein n=1 Tax=Streptomyces violascens TaxID=67381 RepID=UPI00364D56FC
MDLHVKDSKPTDEERAAVDAVLGPPSSAWEGADDRTDAELRWARGGKEARDRRDLLLPALHAVNDRVGWLSESALDYICRRLTVPPAEAYGVATFYSLFSLKPRPATVLYVCTDLTCAAKGSAELCDALADTPSASWERSPCLGLCERAPAALLRRAGPPAPGAAPPDPPSRLNGARPQSPDGLGKRDSAARKPPDDLEVPAQDPARGAGNCATGHARPAAEDRPQPAPPPTLEAPVQGTARGARNCAISQPQPAPENRPHPAPAGPPWTKSSGEFEERGPRGSALGNGPQANPYPRRPAAEPLSVTAGRGGVGKETAPRLTAVLAPATPTTLPHALAAPDATAPEHPAAHAVPQFGQNDLVLLKRIGKVDPYDLDDYRSQGGYTALRRAFALGPAGVIREVLDAGLVGRGGAAFPTGRKWEATARQAERVHYLVCNADESEPGTFKDRVLMEGDPYALVEAMTIAGYAVGAERGYLYLRGEYPRAHERLSHAIARARERGLLGPDVLGQGYAFDIEIRSGAGAYICGEETAIFNSIEGQRGEPRSKPPFPVEKGLFGKPTAVNNVETLVNVLPILEHGAQAYARTGTATSTGTKLFCVSGNVARPGVYELPFGASLRELITLSGPPERMRAILLGGAAGGFVRPDELDIPLTFEGTREAGTTLGSGVVLVLDDTVELPRILLRIAEFFRDESCGQCVPCRVGTVRQEEALHRIKDRTGAAAAGDIALLRDVGRTMRDASICGLGQTAWNAVESAIDRLGAFE